MRIKDEAELSAMGLAVDPANPTQALPVKQIYENHKFDEGDSTEAILASVKTIFSNICQAERQLALEYWRAGDGLRILRQRHKYGRWMPWLKEQGLDYQRVRTAITVRKAHETPDKLTDITVAEALGISTDIASDDVDPSIVYARHGETYLMHDGRVVLYDMSPSGDAYLWDGKTIEADWPHGGDLLEVSETKLDPPTAKQLEAVFPTQQRPDIDEQDDEPKTKPSLRVVNGTAPASANSKAGVPPPHESIASNPNRWEVHCIIDIIAKDAAQASDMVKGLNERGGLFINRVRIEKVTKGKIAKPKPVKLVKQCKTFCRQKLAQIRKDTGIKTTFDVSDPYEADGKTCYEVLLKGRKLFDGPACCEWEAAANALKKMADDVAANVTLLEPVKRKRKKAGAST